MYDINLKRLKEMLIAHEGLRHSPYRCSEGYLTIGVGHNLDSNPITYDAIMQILEDDLWVVNKALRNYPWWGGLNEVRKEALMDFMFNVGPKTFANFKNMIAAIEAKNYDKAADELLDSRYARQVGKRAQTIARLLRTGEY